MNTPFGKRKLTDAERIAGRKMTREEQRLAKDDEVKLAFNVLQALWKAKGEKPMKMVVDIHGQQRNGKKNTMRMTITVDAEYLEGEK